MIWTLLFLASLAHAEFTPLPASTPESTNSNFKAIDEEVRRIDAYVTGLSTTGYVTQSSSNNWTGSSTFTVNQIFGTGVSSYTVVPDGTVTQASYLLSQATVTLTLTGGFDLEVTLSCGGSMSDTEGALGGWSILYDHSNTAFGLSATIGANKFGGSAGGGEVSFSGSFPIKRTEITAGSHTFGLMFASQVGTNVTWPRNSGTLTTACRFGVKEIH